MQPHILPAETVALIQVVYRRTGSKAATARELSLHRDTIRKYVEGIEAAPDAAVAATALREAQIQDAVNRTMQGLPLRTPQELEAVGLLPRIQFKPSPAKPTVYIFTAAQNNTEVHEEFWRNLVAYSEHKEASLYVGGFIYNKSAQGQRGQEKTHDGTTERNAKWDSRLNDYRLDVPMSVAPGLQWRGEMNALPTNVDPLTGLTNYSRGSSAIYPHVKIALRSLDTAPGEDPKFLYTTGAVTMPNYIQRKAGQIAEFHHVIGALIVEVDADGKWFARHINATDDGAFQDLDAQVAHGRVTTGHSVFAVNWGDIHERKLEPEMREAGWGAEGILDQMRPKYQFFHDLVDAESANPHTMGDHLQRYDLVTRGKDDITDELDEVGDFLVDTFRPGITSVVVPSNHDDMITRWLKAVDPKKDPKNVRLWCQANLAAFDLMDEGQPVDLIKWYLQGKVPPSVVFIPPSLPTFKLKGIEFGLHGHLGAKGNRRPSDKSFAALATKINKGHTHSASIIDGVYTAGVQASLFHGYNVGYGSWSNSMIFTYDNGKRVIVTMRGTKYRGGQA